MPEAEVTNAANTSRKSRVIYLAGGFHSGWQKLVWQKLGAAWDIRDPSKHGIQDAASFTEWDLQAIRDCDVVLAMLEPSNPGGYALALEVGYAKALGKVIYLVHHQDDPRSRYFSMLREVSNGCFGSLSSALEVLEPSERQPGFNAA